MLRYVVAMLCGVSLTSSVYMAGFSPQARGGNADECQDCVPVEAKATPVAFDMTGKTDMKNTKCIVMADDVGTSKVMVEYKGNVYHCCCGDCVATFNKDPEKYVKAFDADKAKFGVK